MISHESTDDEPTKIFLTKITVAFGIPDYKELQRLIDIKLLVEFLNKNLDLQLDDFNNFNKDIFKDFLKKVTFYYLIKTTIKKK